MITITPYQDAHRPSLVAVQVRDDQVAFSGQPSQFIDLNLSYIDIHVILDRGFPVGMFRIDRAYHISHPFTESVSIGLRTFLIDHNAQGRGIAKAAARQLKSYLHIHYPSKHSVYLTVNLRNPAARVAYLSGGFIDTGTQYMLGTAGPQQVLKLPLL